MIYIRNPHLKIFYPRYSDKNAIFGLSDKNLFYPRRLDKKYALSWQFVGYPNRKKFCPEAKYKLS